MGTLSRILEKILVKSQDWVQKLKLLFEIFEKISIWSGVSYIYLLFEKKNAKKES